MRLPRALARINRRVVNPIQLQYAGVIPGHGIIEHTGRRSGRPYRTPVLVFRADGGYSMIVGYGLRSDWLKNVMAAGDAGLRHRGEEYRLSRPRLLQGQEAYDALPRPIRRFARLVRIEGVLRVEAAPARSSQIPDGS